MSAHARFLPLYLLFGYTLIELISALPSSSSAFATSTNGPPHTTPFAKFTPSSISNNHITATNETSDVTDVPGVWYSACQLNGDWPCIAYCSSADIACQQSASSVTRTCSASWKSYSDVQNGYWSAGPAWRNTTSIVSYTNPGGTRTTEVEVFTSFVTASQGFVVGVSTPTTMTPVYAIGPPALSLITTSEPLYPEPTYTVLTAPTPGCKYTSYGRMDRAECGRCTITGGTVDLYFWPPSTTPTVTTTIVNGETLVYPSVYISLRTVYASDSCLQVGRRHTGTMLAMEASDISTQIHVGGKAAGYTYGQLRYSDLIGLPPASNYEAQPSCLKVGCPTIYYTSWNPTLVVPSQIRAIDPAWASCGFALEGLYDPPIALTARDAEATMTMSTTPTSGQPSPHKTADAGKPVVTWSIQASTVSKTSPTSKNTGSNKSTPSQAPNATSQTKTEADPSELSLASHSHGNGPPSAPTDQGSQASTRLSEPKTPSPETGHVRPSQGNPNPPGTEHGLTGLPLATLNPNDPGSSVSGQYGASVVVDGHTLHPGEIQTIGTGASETLISMLRHGGSTFVVYGHTSTIPIESESTTGTTNVASMGGFSIGTNSQSQYIVDGHTLAPGSPVTVIDNKGTVTVSIVRSRSRTYIAIGTTTTVPLPVESSMTTPLLFTQASNGNFVLHGTTFASGKPITIGAPGDRTTLRITTISSVPAIVVNGATTELLGHAPISKNISTSASVSLPVIITHVSAPPVPPKSTSSMHATLSQTSDGTCAVANLAGLAIAGLSILWCLV